VKVPASALEALRAQVEAMALEPQLNRWTHEQRRLPIRQRLDDAPGRANTRQLREGEL